MDFFVHKTMQKTRTNYFNIFLVFNGLDYRLKFELIFGGWKIRLVGRSGEMFVLSRILEA